MGRGTTLPTLAIVVSAVLWGVWWMPIRRLDQSGVTGDWASLLLFALASAALVPVAVARRRTLAAHAPVLAAVGLFMGGAMVAWNHALITGEVVRATLLFYLAPLWATGLALVVLKERVSPVRAVSIPLGLAGAAVLLGFEDGFPLPRSVSDVMAVMSGVSFALGATFARKAQDVGVAEKIVVTMFGGAVAAILLATMLATPPPSRAEVAAALPLFASVTLLWWIPLFWLILWAATRLEPGRVAVLLLLEIVVAAVTATWLAGEPFGWREGLGMVLIVGAGLVDTLGDRWRVGPRGAAASLSLNGPRESPDENRRRS
ncbi:MAG: DMT family transporter [Alphaproteobacteria bacterium]